MFNGLHDKAMAATLCRYSNWKRGNNCLLSWACNGNAGQTPQCCHFELRPRYPHWLQIRLSEGIHSMHIDAVVIDLNEALITQMLD